MKLNNENETSVSTAKKMTLLEQKSTITDIKEQIKRLKSKKEKPIRKIIREEHEMLMNLSDAEYEAIIGK